MRILAKKTDKKILLLLKFAVGVLISIAGAVMMPIATFVTDPALLKNGFAWLVVLVGMFLFLLVGYCSGVYPYLLYKKLPEVQAETDGEYLYIYGKKEAKIPFSDMDGAYFDADIPYMLSYEFLVHIFSEQYGKVIIEVPKYGKYKLHFISGARDVPGVLASLAESRMRGESV